MKNTCARPLCLASLMLLLCACSSGVDRDYEVLANQNLTCPDGAHVEYDPWGGNPTGMIASCKLNHGPYIVATGGNIRLKGENRMGKKSGEMIFFDEAGKIEQLVP